MPMFRLEIAIVKRFSWDDDICQKNIDHDWDTSSCLILLPWTLSLHCLTGAYPCSRSRPSVRVLFSASGSCMFNIVQPSLTLVICVSIMSLSTRCLVRQLFTRCMFIGYKGIWCAVSHAKTLDYIQCTKRTLLPKRYMVETSLGG